MIVNTKAIVLTSVKFGEADLIVKCYTEEGVKSYMLKHILRSKSKKLNKAYFQPLTQLSLTAVHNNKGNLNSIREARVYFVYTSLNQNIIKQSIAIFLSEVLSSALREEDRNPNLFEYLQTTFQWLETHDHVSNFHLLFLLNLTRHLGFYPETKNINMKYFNLEEGYFTDYKPVNLFIEGVKLRLFKSLIGTNFDVLERLNFSVKSRQLVLNDLITYYELHLPGFKKPKSLDILKGLFKK